VLRIAFDEAIRRAIERNPTVQAATAGILRAEGLLRQARAAMRLQVVATSRRRRSIPASTFRARR